MDKLKQLISNSSDFGCFRVSNLNCLQNELSFLIGLSYEERNEVFDVKVIKSTHNVQIRFKPASWDFVNRVEKNPWIVNHMNSRLALGIFKYKKQRKLLFYSYSFDLAYYSAQLNIYFIKLFTKLIKVYLSEVSFIQKSKVLDFDYQRRKLADPELRCEDCNIQVSLCECINTLIETDKNVTNFSGIIQEIQKLPFMEEYFDTVSGFFDPESLIYFYNPGNLLGNRMKNLKIGENFKSKLFSMFETMEKNSLFFKTFPFDLIQVSDIKGVIDDFTLALIFENISQFKRRFTHKYEKNYINEMRIAFEILIIQSSQTRGVVEEDFIDVNTLDFPEIETKPMIGCGGFGKVFKNKYLGKTVAIKVEEVKKSSFSILNEFSFLKRFEHRYVIKSYGVVRYHNKKCLVMPYVKGESLRKLDENLVSVVDKLKLMRNVAKGLAYVHKFQVIHQDIKPHNILFKAKRRCPVIIDFGLATHFWSRKDVRGFSFGYTDPAQLLNESSGVEADIWSFVMVLYWVLFQKNPFEFLKQTTKSDMKVLYKQIHNNFLRPLIPESFSSNYSQVADLMKDCWKTEPKNRPSALEIFRRLTDIIDCFQASGLNDFNSPK